MQLFFSWFFTVGFLILAPVQNGYWNYDRQKDIFFDWDTRRVEKSQILPDIRDGHVLNQTKGELRTQLLEMLGLDPLPEKSPLKIKITGIVELGDIVVEKIVFQSVPGLYVTGNLYRPKTVEKPLPTILYVCGHATVVKDGIAYGSKAHYQHHGLWYARQGYICLVLDTLQLGEMEGIHHGTYRYDRWWWMSTGYTPAGIEAWNGIRALDYLVTRSDVDKDNLGLTGRSGGGATSWWIGALDDRVKVVVPVAGITDLRNHVVDGCVEGHCDCMYYLNTYRWDFDKLALLIAPRPLLIANADQDNIFPLDGVYRTYSRVRNYYDLLNVPGHLALNIVGGGHHDIQDIQIPAFRWFNRFLKGVQEDVSLTATKDIPAEQLRVLTDFPEDALNASIDEHFTELAPFVAEQLKKESYKTISPSWFNILSEKVFSQWPLDFQPVLQMIDEKTIGDLVIDLYQLQTDSLTSLPMLVLQPKSGKLSSARIQVMDASLWAEIQSDSSVNFQNWSSIDLEKCQNLFRKGSEETLKETLILLPVRGIGAAAFTGNKFKMDQIRRRYYLLGSSLETWQTWDLHQGISTCRKLFNESKLKIQGSSETAGMLLYAGIFFKNLDFYLNDPLWSHRSGLYYPMILKYFDVPAALLMTAENNNIYLSISGQNSWREFISQVPVAVRERIAIQ